MDRVRFKVAVVSGRLEVKGCKLLWTFRVCAINFVGENVFGVGVGNGPIYSLVVAEAGKLHEAPGDCAPEPTTSDSSKPPCGSLRVFPWVGRMDGLKVPITRLVANLSKFTKRMVLNNTHLGGKYDMNLKWFPGPSEFPPRPAYLPPTYQPDPNSPPLLTAIQQQLGLKLESRTGPVPLLVIDHVEKLSEN
jgi:uncharacterized protein (TIGR03435 family)